ncbi:MAG TPA: LysR family transcriptional regulator [Rhizobium sp.]
MHLLNQKQLMAFRAVMITGGVGTGAEMLNVTQPAISRLIRDLEYQVGVPLFVRKRGDVLRPTSDAATLFRDVERYFIGLEQVGHSVNALRKRRGGRLRVAALPALYMSLLPRFIGEFTAARPEIEVPLMATSSETIVDWVATGRADLGLVDWPLDHPRIKRSPLPPLEPLAVIPENHPLTKKDVLSPTDFANDPFVSVLRGTQLRVNIDRFFLDAGVERVFGNEADLSMAACSTVAAGGGLSIIDPITAVHYFEDGLCFRPMYPAIELSFSAIHLSSSSDGLLEVFLREFRDAFAIYIERLPRLFMRRSQLMRPDCF